MSQTATLDAIGDLLSYLTPEEQRELDEHLAALAADEPSTEVGVPAPSDWRTWLTTLFPKHFYHPFGRRHDEFWSWVWAIEPDSAPRPFIAIWPRESGKSTNAEAAVTALGCRGKRKYAIYIRVTQDKADDSVMNIAALLESDAVAKHYPAHANRMVGKFGQAKGWRHNRLRTAGGFTVDALGLDVPVRGIKMEDQRPDLIIIDDCDAAEDSPKITAKKLALITRAVLPAGAQNVAVLGAQNLINRGGIFTQLADGSADFLADRIVSGPYPAVEGLEYEWRTDPVSSVRYAHITKGRATWEGQPLDVCQRNIRRWSLSAFMKEAQHRVADRVEGAALRFIGATAPEGHLIDLTDDECCQLIDRARRSQRISVFGGIDFGAWRFGFTLWVVDEHGRAIRVDEYFAQRRPGEAGLAERAREIHETCAFYGIPVEEKGIPIWGDAANPTDIHEINLAFRNGWLAEYEEHGKRVQRHITSRLRVVPVAGENKLRKTSVERMNNMLDQRTLLFRRGVTYEWMLGKNAGSEGTPQLGSRLLWEIDNWSYPIPKPGEEQSQDPDDATADGGDMIASARYAIMSVYGATKLPAEAGVWPQDRSAPMNYQTRKLTPPAHVGDLLTGGGRRMPSVRMPRPRGR